MSEGPAVSPADLGLAGCGDLSALRRLRDYWFELANGDTINPLIPQAEAVPQMELLAELAAAGGEPGDYVSLVVACQIRIESLGRERALAEAIARDAVAENDADKLARWSSSVVDVDGRLKLYREKLRAVVQTTLADEDPEGAALLVMALTSAADGGDEKAVGVLQYVIDAVPAARAVAIQNKVREIERERA